MRDTSLDDFSDDSDDTGSSGGEESTIEGGQDSIDQESKQPVGEDGEASTSGDHDAGEKNIGSPTSRWSPDGTACADCAETATRLWQQGGRLVCASCKNWE
jgi:hypothetical protein